MPTIVPLVFVRAKKNGINNKNQGSVIIIAAIEIRIQSLIDTMNSQLYSETTLSAASAKAAEAIENAFYQQAREMADLIGASRIQKAIENNEMAAAVTDFSG